MEGSDKVEIEEVEDDQNGHEEMVEEEDVEEHAEGEEEHAEGEEESTEVEEVEEGGEEDVVAGDGDGEGDGEGGEEDDEEEVDDDHEIHDVDCDEEGEGEGGEGGDEEEAATEEEENKKFPSPIDTIGNFDAIEDAEIKELMQKTSMKLYDKTTGLLLSRGPKYSDEKWPINCHICYESGIYTLKDLKEHLRSARHVRMLRWRPTDPKYKHMKAFRQPFDDEDQTLTPIFIYPGEVITEITPDLLDRIQSKEKVPERDVADMMGLSYGYKMKRFGKEIYDCFLCRKMVSILHFAGQKHIDKYIDVHFPRTWKKIRTMIKESKLGWTTSLLSQQQKYIREAVRQIYKKLEEDKGLRQPKFVNYRDFKINRYTYQKQARTKKHYDEKSMELTDEMLVDYLKQAHEKLGDPKVLKADDEEKEERSRRRSVSRDAGRLTSDRSRLSRRGKIIENDPQVWDRYRRMVGAIMDDLEEQYSKFRRDLESHPKYKSEWKKFWHNRADELERDGVDPHTYDFNKEWIPYWEKRLQEFHAKEIVRHKFETKRKLNLSYDVRSPSPVRRRRRGSPRRRTPSPRSRHLRRRSREPSAPRSKRSRRVDDGPVTVCNIMRLVAALEDNLGSLGPQAVQLLSRAVLTEKSNPNPDCLLSENDYYIFFMTAKEKLKGQLLANIIEPRKVSAVEKVVDQISSIVNRFEDFRSRNGNRGSFSSVGGVGSGNQFPDGGQQIRYPNQFSGGNRGGVWHTGNYRGGDGSSGIAPMSQNFNRSMVPGSYGGGNDNETYGNQGGGGGNDYGNRGGAGGTMSIGSGRNMSGGPQNFGDNGTGPSYGSSGGNYGGMGGRSYGGNENFSNPPSFRGDTSNRNRGGNIGGHPGKGDMGINRNSMSMGVGQNRPNSGNTMDFDNMSRGGGGNNQMSFNRGNRADDMSQPSGGGRPWSSGYNQSDMSSNNNYSSGMGSGGSGSNWNSGDFGGNSGNQSFNRPHPVPPPAGYRNTTSGGGRY